MKAMSKTQIIYIIAVCLITISLVVIAFLYPRSNSTHSFEGLEDNDVIRITYLDSAQEGKEIILEVAVSSDKTAEGLMNREELIDIDGMLFIFEEERELRFWMKDTLIPLDIIYINSDFEVVSIAENTKPNQTDEKYPSNFPAKYVIEVEANTSTGKGFQEGDIFNIQKIEKI